MSALPALEASEFASFFIALNGVHPFPWQQRLLDDLVAGKWLDAEINPQQWPAAMALPTASGKTACIDIALFHLALQADSSRFPLEERTAPRRIFFCVDRRVIVDEAYDRARRITVKLACAVGQRHCDDCRAGAGGSKCAQNGTLRSVGSRLRHLAGGDDAAPLAVFQLRGGTYRDDAWATSPVQPTVICTTVDQLGSRLLFRGYGVSPRSASIHAGLAANDALILLDEAHCAEPFRQTLDAVRLFRGERWAEQPLMSPFAFVEMSATPRSESKLFELDDDDRKDVELSKRLNANKLAVLRASDYATATEDFAKELTDCALDLVKAGSERIAVMVNRVDTARHVHERLRQSSGCDAILMIGRMRPLDRDDLVRQWQPKLKATPGIAEHRETHEKPIVVVATQCLEVGANLDFDALITEAASLDALRQRFGRLNRLGRDKQCSAVIVAPRDSIKEGADDPIYGPAIAKTWKWLETHAVADRVAGDDSAPPKARKRKKAAAAETARTIDFGIAALSAKLPQKADERAELLKELSAPSPDAPVMLPAHLDLWCQTAPIPDPDPDVSIYLHGPQRGVPTVNVCWRADLGDDPDQWAEIVSLLPPSSLECMPVPLHLVRRWMQNAPPESKDDTGDVEDAAFGADDDRRNKGNAEARYVLRWRGRPESGARNQTCATNDSNNLRPGDVVVIRVQDGGWNDLGHIPGSTTPNGGDTGGPDADAALAVDCAEQANLIARRRGVLRLHASFLPSTASADGWIAPARDVLAKWNPDEPPDDFYPLLNDALAKATKPPAGMEARDPAAARARIAHELSGISASRLQRAATPHPAGGIVLSLPRRISLGLPQEAEEDGSSDDPDESNVDRRASVTLDQHTRGVVEQATCFAFCCLPDDGDVRDALRSAAGLHDLGKLDPRWQGMIRGGQPPARVANLPPLAKSEAPLRTWDDQRNAARRADLPDGFRHEMLSMQVAEHHSELLKGAPEEPRDLILHLIASHHGHARPFAPIVEDKTPPPLPAIELKGVCPTADASVRLAAIDAGQRIEWEQCPAHRLDSGVCDRFWTLTRRYGWWGLAYLEAILRLADRAVSRDEQQHSSEGHAT